MRILTTLLLCLSLTATAQEQKRNEQDSLLYNIIKFTPLRLIGIEDSNIEVKYERNHNTRFSSQITSALLIPFSIGLWDYDKGKVGFEIGIEEKYFIRNTAPNGSYFSLEYRFLKNTRNKTEQFADVSSQEYYYDTFTIKRTFHSLNFKWGYQKLYTKLILDVFIGMGYRYKKFEHFDRTDPSDKLMENMRDYGFWPSNSNEEGVFHTFTLPLNFGIGVTF